MSESILVVGPSWVGDMVMAQSLFKALRFKHPNASIDILAPEWSAGILQRMPEVRHVIHMPIGHGVFGWGARKQLGRSLAGQYQQAYVLPNSWKSALVPWFAKIPQRIGYLGEWRLGLLTNAQRLNKGERQRLVDRYVGLAGLDFQDTFTPSLKVDTHAQASLLKGLDLEADQPILALCAGAEYGPAKRWPARYYAEVARSHIEKGWQVWLMGSANDAATNQEILQALAQLNRSELIGSRACRRFARIHTRERGLARHEQINHESGRKDLPGAGGRSLGPGAPGGHQRLGPHAPCSGRWGSSGGRLWLFGPKLHTAPLTASEGCSAWLGLQPVFQEDLPIGPHQLFERPQS